jgi:hypothetical protein
MGSIPQGDLADGRVTPHDARKAADTDAALPRIATWARCSVMRVTAQDNRADGFLARVFFLSGCRPRDGRRSLDRAGSSSLPATRTKYTTNSLRLSAMITSCGSSSTAEEISGAIPNGSAGVFEGAGLPLCPYPSRAAEGRIVLTLDAHAAAWSHVARPISCYGAPASHCGPKG